MREFALIDRYFRPLASHAAAGGLADDATVLMPPAGRALVITKDMIASGVHFRPEDPPESVAAKLLAVNLSDLAAMGAVPLGCVLGLGLARATPEAWVAAFARGLGEAADRWQCPLLGGDTIGGLDRPVLSLTAFGHGGGLPRSGAVAGDDLWVSGSIGGAGEGLRLLNAGAQALSPDQEACIQRYQRPEPRLALGQALVGLAHAAADVSDGLLADAAHIAEASGVAITIALADVPLAAGCTLSPAAAASAGDDYELVFAASVAARPALVTLSQTLALKLTRIGGCSSGSGLVVLGADGQPMDLSRLGYEHESSHGQDTRPESTTGEDAASQGG